MSQTAPIVFLSHSGADADAARDLKRRLLAAPDARASGLKVWFDKDDLRPGVSWQSQIEQAIVNATAFVVYIGSKGVMNWVEAEVRVALSRATGDKGFLFIPALAADSAGSSALPPFAKLYQGVRDPLSDGEELAKLLKAVLGQSEWDKAVQTIGEPFVGLRSMREEEADRFFGRDAEVKELVEKFRRCRIVAIVADSGTGKSSLAQAAFIPAFRGGALTDFSRDDPDERVWHAVTMLPGANPIEGLRTGITEAAERLGQLPEARAGLRKRVTITDPSETAFALQCDLQARKTATLLIVDQFEELFTATPNALVGPFVKLLLDLVDGDKDIRILLTVRADYFNLVSEVKNSAGEAIRGADCNTLFERINAEGGDAILRLKRVLEEGLSDVICKPLRLAGVSDDQTALVKAVQSDISDQPSDLPLLQVALKAAWQERKTAGRSMLDAYQSVGGVRRALANEAEKVRNRLSGEDQARLESVFVRLVRLGDTGGATRRTALLDEFDEARRELLQQLGRDDYGRLIALGEKSVEIAHEALITQWPWLQGRLKADVRDVRRLERLMDRSREWRDAPADKKSEFLAFGAEREFFSEVAEQRPDWLSTEDRQLVEASNQSYQAELDRKQKEFQTARRNESVALTELAFNEATKNPINAVKLALAAWPRDTVDTATPKLSATLDALGEIVPKLQDPAFGREATTLAGHKDRLTSGAFGPDGTRIVTASHDNTARLWDAVSGRANATLEGHTATVNSAAFSPDGTRIATASYDNTAWLWDAASGRAITTFAGHTGRVSSAAFNSDGTRVVTASDDNTARLWDAASGRAVATLEGHTAEVKSASFSPDGTRIVTASQDRTARLWETASGRTLAKLAGHAGAVCWAAFSPDGTRIVTASHDNTARLWDAASGRALATLVGHKGSVVSAAFSQDGRRVVTASWDETARVWGVGTIPKGHILQVACKLLNGNFSLDGLTGHGFKFDRPICATDAPPPDLTAEPAAR